MDDKTGERCVAPGEGGRCGAAAVEWDPWRNGWVCEDHVPMYEMTTRHLELMAMGERHLLQAGAVKLDGTNRDLFDRWAGRPTGDEQS